MWQKFIIVVFLKPVMITDEHKRSRVLVDHISIIFGRYIFALSLPATANTLRAPVCLRCSILARGAATMSWQITLSLSDISSCATVLVGHMKAVIPLQPWQDISVLKIKLSDFNPSFLHNGCDLVIKQYFDKLMYLLRHVQSCAMKQTERSSSMEMA